MDFEDMFFIFYIFGFIGKFKGVVYICGGYMVYIKYFFENVFQYQEGDIYWCMVDIGWIIGYFYIVYGFLLVGVIIVMFEGVFIYLDVGCFW